MLDFEHPDETDLADMAAKEEYLCDQAALGHHPPGFDSIRKPTLTRVAPPPGMGPFDLDEAATLFLCCPPKPPGLESQGFGERRRNREDAKAFLKDDIEERRLRNKADWCNFLDENEIPTGIHVPSHVCRITTSTPKDTMKTAMKAPVKRKSYIRTVRARTGRDHAGIKITRMPRTMPRCLMLTPEPSSQKSEDAATPDALTSVAMETTVRAKTAIVRRLPTAAAAPSIVEQAAKLGSDLDALLEDVQALGARAVQEEDDLERIGAGLNIVKGRVDTVKARIDLMKRMQVRDR